MVELIKISGLIFKAAIGSSLVEAMEAFTDMTKLVEAFGLEEVLVVVQVIGSDTETQSHRRTIYRRSLVWILKMTPTFSPEVKIKSLSERYYLCKL